MKPKIRIHDISTDEVIDREMTDTEFAEYEAQQALDDSRSELLALQIAKKLAAQAKLEALGLTTDDLKALGL